MEIKHFLVLLRIYGEKGTNGSLSYNNELICRTIELPWRNNLPRLSCIPAGTYRLFKKKYRKHGEQIGLANVLEREAILIHAANDAGRELMGCIAPVMDWTGEGRGSESRKALALLKGLVYSLWDMDDEVFLLIK